MQCRTMAALPSAVLFYCPAYLSAPRFKGSERGGQLVRLHLPLRDRDAREERGRPECDPRLSPHPCVPRFSEPHVERLPHQGGNVSRIGAPNCLLLRPFASSQVPAPPAGVRPRSRGYEPRTEAGASSTDGSEPPERETQASRSALASAHFTQAVLDTRAQRARALTEQRRSPGSEIKMRRTGWRGTTSSRQLAATSAITSMSTPWSCSVRARSAWNISPCGRWSSSACARASRNSASVRRYAPPPSARSSRVWHARVPSARPGAGWANEAEDR